MCVKREGVGNLCGGLFTILMLIIMFSVAHRRFQELIYISLAFIAITLTLCIIFAIFNTVCKGGPLINYWDSNHNNSYYNTRHHSSRYRNHNYNNNINASAYNQQRVHVCTPPTMGGARLNIIYTIGQQQNNQYIHSNQTLNTIANPLTDSVAINIDNNNGSLWRLPMSSSRSPRSLSPCPPQYLNFTPIIRVMTNNNNNCEDNYQQIISSYGDYSTIEPILPLDSDIINDLNYRLPDLPPLYHQLSDVIPTDGPPTYEEAIEDKDTK